MAVKTKVHPINIAQCQVALTTYAGNQTIVNGLNALIAALNTNNAYKCSKCGGSGTISDATLTTIYCMNPGDSSDTCLGNGVVPVLLKAEYTEVPLYKPIQ